jgi:hypothetical protein
MKRVMYLVVAVLSVFVYEFAMAAANNPPSAPVTIVNTASNPVPVTGSFGISGTANVNVTNTVPVINSENPARSPFWGTGMDQFNDELESLVLAVGSVPAGKRLIIEYVGVHCSAALDEEFGEVSIRVWKKDGETYTFFDFPIPMGYQGQINSVRGGWTSSQNVRLYSDGGDHQVTIRLSRLRAGTSTGPGCSATISGYTIDVP